MDRIGKLCKGATCNAIVLWVALPSKKRMLIDATPRADGNIKLDGTEDGDGTANAFYISKAETWTGPRYVSHFATCPDRQEFRKKGDEKRAARP